MALAPLPEGVEEFKELTDAPTLSPGTTEIWFSKKDFFFRAISCFKGLKETFGDEMPTVRTLEKTHVFLGKVNLPLDKVFMRMQGEMWSPLGEARGLIKGAGLGHTSMTMGDVVIVDGVAYMVALEGFERLDA